MAVVARLSAVVAHEINPLVRVDVTTCRLPMLRALVTANSLLVIIIIVIPTIVPSVQGSLDNVIIINITNIIDGPAVNIVISTVTSVIIIIIIHAVAAVVVIISNHIRCSPR